MGGVDGARPDQPGRRWSRLTASLARSSGGSRWPTSTAGTPGSAPRASASRRCATSTWCCGPRCPRRRGGDGCSTNVAALATLGRRTVAPRSAMSAVEVRAVIEAAGRLDPAAGVAFRLAAITGARRAELCALVCADLDGDRLTIDSSIAIERSGSVAHRQVPALIDAATKTGNRRVVRLDPQTVAAIEALWSLERVVGSVAADAVRATAEPGAADELVAPGPPGRRPRPTLAAPRPAPLVGHRGHRPRPRHPDRRRPPGPRQPGHDPADVCARAGRRRRRRRGDAGGITGR